MPKKLQCVRCENIFNDMENHEFDFKLKDGEHYGTIMVPTVVKMYCSIGEIPDDYICCKCAKAIIARGGK